jgi:hypothetical protein
VTESLSVPVAQDVVARYEELRQDAFSRSDGTRGIGLTLFLREGMARWMRACPSVPAPRPQPESAATITRWSCDVRAQAAAILAGILLNFRSETTPCMAMGTRSTPDM